MADDENIEKRITDMYKALGYDTEDPLISAEIAAYTAGISMVKEKIAYAEQETQPYTAKYEGLEYLCELMNVDSHLPAEELRQIIIKRMNTRYGEYTFGELAKAIAAVSSKIKASVSRGRVLFNNLDDKSIDILPQIGRIIEEYIMPPAVISSTGSGCTFAFWDNTEYRFEEYDGFNCPFSLLETVIPNV